MALLDGHERSEMPSLSWNSVVKERSSSTVSLPEIDSVNGEDDSGEPASLPPVAFSTSTLTSAAPNVAPSAPLAPVTPPAAPIVAPTPSISLSPVLPPTGTPAPPTPAEQHAAAPPAPPEPVAPAPEALPEIVEATPAAPVVAQVATPPAPPTQAFNLPPTAAALASPAHQVLAPEKARSNKARKDRSGSIARVGFFFLIVGALASAAVIFGRPYLFPAEWEPNALEFSEPIETARGTEFVEPVMLTAQPTDAHRSMVATQLLGDPASDLAMWRALGLAGPDSTDDETLQALISEQSPVLYSTIDGQVYYDQAFTRSDRATLISRAMATAALDQEYSFSTDASSRSLLDEALTEAHVRQQAALIEQSATDRPPVPVTDVAALAYLPAVLDYRLTAPTVFTDLLPPRNEVAPNPLADLALNGPGPLSVPALEQIPSASLVVGDTVVGPAVVTDRSFWFLSFASHLDAATAYGMSSQLKAAGLQMVEGPNGTCAVATFVSAAPLKVSLDAWVAATAPELGASVVATPDGEVQLRSCDPAGTYASKIRFGVARQLIAYQSVELVVTNLVVAQGGTQADIAAAIARISSTPSAAAVAQLPAGTTPADLAAAAQSAGADVIGDAASPAVAAPAVAGGG